MPVRKAKVSRYPEKVPFIAAIFALFWLNAQAAETDAASRRASSPLTYSLLEQARSAPPEFGAFAMLRLLGSNAVPGREWQLETATEALRMAANATHAAPRRLAPGLQAADNQAMLRHAAAQQGLDRLTLSLRAIEQIRRVDPASAAEEFSRIPRPVASVSTCADPLVDDFSSWYAAAARLGVSPLSALQTLGSHVEIAPAIGLILQSAADSESLEAMAGALAARLSQLPADDRTFNAALFHAPSALLQLRQVLASRNLPTAPLDEGWLTWMRNGMAAPACAETRAPGAAKDAREEAFALFNRTFTPLDPELLKPTGDPVAAAMDPFADNEAIRRQARLLHQLLFGDGSAALPEAQKATPEWREKLDEYMRSIEARTQSGEESANEFFFRQCQLWAGVIIAAPAGAAREKAVAQYIGFLLRHAPHIDPAIWFSQLTALVESTRSLHGTSFPRILEALEQSGHPVLSLYAQLEAAHPTRPGHSQQ
jgi:hypothetical protein